jgi:hypothetical protein
MLVTLSAATVDPSGFLELDVADDTTAGQTTRRVTRVATLDGGAAVNDAGAADADRTITLRWQARTPAQEAAVDRLVRLHARVQVALPGAVFAAVPETYTPGQPESSLRLLVLARLSA